MSNAKSLDDFKKAHDPTFKLENVGATLRRDINWAKTGKAIVVAAQNATPVEKDFWAILNYIASLHGAELLVIPVRYKNPTSQWSGSQKNAEFWAPEVRPYLWNVREDMNPNLMILGDLRVQPTNSNPLQDADALSHGSSAIIGHTRAQSKSVATPQSKMAKFLQTSGTCTVANYTDSRIGKLGEFHHSLSAIFVEQKGKRFHMRRLNYSEKTKRVIDLGVAYYAKKHETAPPSLALVQGDTHVDFVDGKVVEATFGIGGIVQRIRPKNLIWHDLLDGHAVNPHHRDNPFADIAKWLSGRASASAETKRAIEFVNEKTQLAISLTKMKDLWSRIVPSNHDDMLMRWIKSEDWKKIAAENRIFYLETALHMAKHTAMTDTGIFTPDPFISLVKAANLHNVQALETGEFSIGGIELGLHFDKGPNGARGSLKNIRRIGTRSVGGHSHSPGEDEGAVQVGTSTRLKAEYTGPLSSWLNAHCDVNADSKRQLILIIDGEFTLQ